MFVGGFDGLGFGCLGAAVVNCRCVGFGCGCWVALLCLLGSGLWCCYTRFSWALADLAGCDWLLGLMVFGCVWGFGVVLGLWFTRVYCLLGLSLVRGIV